MKIYLAFLSIHESQKSKIPGFQLVGSVLHWEYKKEQDVWTCLYGWTRDKKTFKKFKETRNDTLFVYRKTEIDITDFNEIEKNYKNNEIVIKEMATNHTSMKIPITEFEYEICTDFSLIAELFIVESNIIDPKIFSKESLKILEKLGYSLLFFEYLYYPDYDDEEEIDRMELFYDRAHSYNEYIDQGKYMSEKNILGNSFKLNEVNSFIYTFEMLLAGEQNDYTQYVS